MILKLPDAFVGEHAEWLDKHVPLFECPDSLLADVYYFRWDIYRKHISQTPEGYMITEFLPQVSWSGAYNSINCPAGHHFYEGRWLRDPTYLDDYARFWFRGGGNPRQYSFWAADSLYARYSVNGDRGNLLALLPDLIVNYEAWETENRESSGLFWQIDAKDGMEFSIGGSGCRPTINSYMYGDAVAIARIAEMSGDRETAERFLEKAQTLKKLVQTKLWDPQRQFFKVLINREGLEHARQLPETWRRDMGIERLQAGQWADVCELIGYIPWYFNLPDPGYEAAWRLLKDPCGFAAPFGPTTAEQRHPMFMLDHSHECLWNGPSWPFATTQTLVAMANLLNHYEQSYVTRDDYYAMLRQYAGSHFLTREDGTTVNWIDENLHPYTGEWLARSKLYARGAAGKDRGKDYNHSAFCDLLISGLIGIHPHSDDRLDVRPLLPEGIWDYFCLDRVPYRGHLITVLYDRTGERYGKGKGFRVYVDGAEKVRTETICSVSVRLTDDLSSYCEKF
jgi:hypothetical protein